MVLFNGALTIKQREKREETKREDNEGQKYQQNIKITSKRGSNRKNNT